MRDVILTYFTWDAYASVAHSEPSPTDLLVAFTYSQVVSGAPSTVLLQQKQPRLRRFWTFGLPPGNRDLNSFES